MVCDKDTRKSVQLIIVCSIVSGWGNTTDSKSLHPDDDLVVGIYVTSLAERDWGVVSTSESRGRVVFDFGARGLHPSDL